jgi:hypothetical protein
MKKAEMAVAHISSEKCTQKGGTTWKMSGLYQNGF